jgi:hypothetical protein
MSLDTHSPRRPASGNPEFYAPDPTQPLDDQPNTSVSWGITSWFQWAVEIDTWTTCSMDPTAPDRPRG